MEATRQKRTAKVPQMADLSMSRLNINNVLSTKNGQLYLGNNLLDAVTRKRLVSEAKALSNFKLYEVFQETCKYTAMDDVVIHSKSWDDVLKGKGALYTLNVLRTLIEQFRRMQD